MRVLLAAAALAWIAALAVGASATAPPAPAAPAAGQPPLLFDTAANCMACHNTLTTAAGEDISIGVSWRATMMANSARDPYWHAAVRREVMDHPAASAEIEDECSVCHMPMARTQAVATGRRGEIFAHLPIGAVNTPEAALAADGVSCTACHQITAEKLGTPESWTGGYVIDMERTSRRPVFGPFAVDEGRNAVMHSATGFAPVEASHIRQSELCATCHTLYTHARGPRGEVLGRFPEQVPYLEWRHSAWRSERSCQSCHMPVVEGPARMASVLGELREGLARHTFRGGNFFMLRMLNRYRTELGVEALPQELDAAVRDTLAHLAGESAALTIERAAMTDGRLVVDLGIANGSGHKLPTAYPSRRVWIRLAVRDAAGRVLFESGAVAADGSIPGNDNDEDARRFEPHYREIDGPNQVQIYEAIMADASGAVTTGLLKAVEYLKDNRLLPRGFDKATAEPDIAVHGGAREDEDFTAGGDRIRYRIDPRGAKGPFSVEAELLFQPIAFRWARNLADYDAQETTRFVRYYDALAHASAARLAHASASVR